MSCFSFPDIAKGLNFTKVSYSLVIRCPETIFIVERFIQYTNVFISQVVHG